MKDIAEHTDKTSSYELYTHLSDKIIAREIITFSQLKEYARPIVNNQKTHPVIMKAFELIKRLYWGFFASMSKATHPKIWRELVISDPTFPAAGDLKRNITISNLFIGMLDIHGYTKFCQESKKNLSMLHMLDKSINNEIRNITTTYNTVSQRERGDEIILISSSATDVLSATLSIIDYFSKSDDITDPTLKRPRVGNDSVLPEFKISAGIAGGNTSTPLIITESGNISGFLLNTAARLQARANELSPKESKVMLAKHVYMSFVKENQVAKSPIFLNNTIYFFNTGMIEFKGVMLPTCEAVFKEEDKYKEKFSDEIERLYGSIRESLWEQKIFVDLMDVLASVARFMPYFETTPKRAREGMMTLNNESIARLCGAAAKAYIKDEDFSGAVAVLKEIVDELERIPNFERLVLDYAKGIAEKYDLILQAYEAGIDKEIDEHISEIFNETYRKAYLVAKNGAAMLDKMKKAARKSPGLTKKKSLWFDLIKKNKEAMTLKIHSGKK